MVITGLTRNQFGSNPTRVRIPPAAPGKGLEPDRAPGFFFFRVRKTRAADLYRSAALVLLQQKDGVNQALRGICMAGGIVKIQRALRQSVGLQSPGRWNFVSGETFECCIVVFKRSNRPSSQEAAVTLL